MLHRDPETIKRRAPEITALAQELWTNDDGGEDFTTTIRRASKLLTGLLDFADAWDRMVIPQADESEAYADEDGPMSECPRCGEMIEDAVLADGCPACYAAALELAPIYVPSALDPAEQRAMDKALYERAGGNVPRRVGRHWFVASRTTGGVVYRVTSDTCSCKAGQAGRLCWHRMSAMLDEELTAV